MGYLDNSSRTLDAILTKKGREILSSGGDFNVTKFALGDDEIDYALWDTTHTQGTDYYGAVIDNLPALILYPPSTSNIKFHFTVSFAVSSSLSIYPAPLSIKVSDAAIVTFFPPIYAFEGVFNVMFLSVIIRISSTAFK